MVGLFSDNKKCTRTDFGCGTSFAKRCSGMVRAQVDVVRQEHSSAVITPVACFAAGHRTLYPRDVRRYDIEMRKMLRRMIPRPVGIDWSAPWHEILHSWHARIDTAVQWSLVNGQWSMPVRHKASPFWAQAVKRNMYIGFA